VHALLHLVSRCFGEPGLRRRAVPFGAQQPPQPARAAAARTAALMRTACKGPIHCEMCRVDSSHRPICGQGERAVYACQSALTLSVHI
jgi:hypothetical protein